MRERTSGSDGSHILPSMQSGRYHSPGFAPSAAIFAQNVFMSIPNVRDDSSQGP